MCVSLSLCLADMYRKWNTVLQTEAAFMPEALQLNM